jgi:VanZ family protein
MGMSRSNVMAFRLALCVALMVIMYLATTPLHYPLVENVDDKVNHVLAFFVLGLLADFSFPKRGLGPSKIFALLGYGLLIEVIQYFLPYRTFSLYDLAADGVGLTLYWCSVPAIKKLPWFRGRWEARVKESAG